MYDRCCRKVKSFFRLAEKGRVEVKYGFWLFNSFFVNLYKVAIINRLAYSEKLGVSDRGAENLSEGGFESIG